MQVFLAPEDEDVVSARFRALMPRVRFIDGQIWPTAEPPLVGTIRAATNRLVYLWDPDVAELRPARPTGDGRFRGSASVMFDRCVLKDDRLLAGSFGGGFSTSAGRAFVERVMGLVRRLTEGGIVSGNGDTTRYRAGPDALRWVAAEPGRAFSAASGSFLYLPLEIGRERWAWLRSES